MKTNHFCIIFILILLANGAKTQAQTTNEGKLTVSENTKFSTVEAFQNEDSGEFYNDGDAYIYDNFSNAGTVDFTQNTGLTRFIGDAEQDLSGGEPSYFYDVLFDNNSATAPFHLSGWINIEGNANFVQGIVDNLNYDGRMDFRDEAMHSNTSDDSHVNGEVGWLSDLDFVYPVGKSQYYRPAKISAPGDPDARFDGEFLFENSDTDASPHAMKPDGIERIDDREYWTIQQQAGSGDEIFVTLSLRDVTTPDFIMEAAEDDAVTIVRWNEEKNLWVDEGGSYDPNTESVTSNAVSGFGKFTLALKDADLTMPCDIVVYNAVTPNDDGNNDYFRIEDNGSCAEELKIKVYNRWGVKVFETRDYGPEGDVFDGFSGGRLTLKENQDRLPSGTYFYIIEYRYEAGKDELKSHQQAGYLFLSEQ